MSPQHEALRFNILGPVEVLRDGVPLDLGGAKQRAVLAALLVARGYVALDRLIDQVWDEHPPPSAPGTLQAYISNLRKTLEPGGRAAGYTVIASSGRSYRLDHGGSLDAERFERAREDALAALRDGRAHDARDGLEGALALWRGDALSGLGEAFAVAEAQRLHELLQATREDLLEAHLACGANAQVIAEATARLRTEPLRERTWGALMLALYRDGRQADALTAYRRAREILAEELGVDPGPDLRRLEAEILAQSPDLAGPGPSPARAPEPAPSRVQAAPRGSHDGPPGARAGSTLVGRDAEVARVERLIEAALDGHGGVALVQGEAGIGKTRLLEELGERAAAGGVRVVWGRAVGGVKAPPMWPWQQIFDALETVDAGNLGALVGDDEGSRAETYRSLALGLAFRAASEPLLAILDDAHWADQASLELLRFVGAAAAAARIVVVAAFRETEVTPALAEAIAALARETTCERIALDGFDLAGVRGIVTDMTGDEPAADLAEALHERTAGNPFFLREIVKLLQTERALDARAQRAVLGVGVPLGVRDVIGRRLASLPERTNELLTLASVLGREFDAAILARADGSGPDTVLEALEPAGAIGIVLPLDAGRLRFSHDLVRETLYDATSPMRRARLHARIGSAMLDLRAGDPAYIQALAHHLFEGAAVFGAERAVPHVLAAADAADVALAYEMTEERLGQALALLDTLPPTEETMGRQLAVSARLARYRAIVYGYAAPSAGEALERTRALAETMGRSEELLIALWGLWGLHTVRAELADADVLAARMLAWGHETGDPLHHLGGHQATGILAMHRGRYEEAEHHLRRGLEICEQLGTERLFILFQQDGLVGNMSFLAIPLAYAGEIAEAERLADASVERGRALGERFSMSFASFFRAWVAVIADDPALALASAEEATALADADAFAQFAAMGAVIEGWARARLGDVPGGEAAVARGVRGLVASDTKMLAPAFLSLRAEVEALAGRPAEAAALLGEADAHAASTGERIHQQQLEALRARLAALPSDAQGHSKTSA